MDKIVCEKWCLIKKDGMYDIIIFERWYGENSVGKKMYDKMIYENWHIEK